MLIVDIMDNNQKALIYGLARRMCGLSTQAWMPVEETDAASGSRTDEELISETAVESIKTYYDCGDDGENHILSTTFDKIKGKT